MIQPSESANSYKLKQDYIEEFERHSATINKHRLYSWGDEGPSNDFKNALEFFGLRTAEVGMNFSFEGNHWDVVLESDVARPNPANNPDFFDLLRDLDKTMALLSGHIRSINDPDRRTPELLSIRAYLDAFRSFIDVERQQPPPEMPSELRRGLLSRLRDFDWFKLSDTAQKWAETITKIIVQLR